MKSSKTSDEAVTLAFNNGYKAGRNATRSNYSDQVNVLVTALHNIIASGTVRKARKIAEDALEDLANLRLQEK